MHATSNAATPRDARSRAGLDDCHGDLDKKPENNMSKSSSFLKKSASHAEVEGVSWPGAHGAAEKTRVPVRHPVTEVGISEIK